ncbi:MAG: hypothetical protein JXR69_09920 [Candidatus Delongbacteria bacterium]|nr:hypothetical protein [Candidatus Delongbacteria bacterium]
MKKFLTLAVIMLLAASYSMDITRNQLAGLVGLDYSMQDKTTGMGLYVPAVDYQFEGKPSDMFKLYLYSDLGYEMMKVSNDGEAVDAASYGKMYFDLKPMGKLYLPSNLFVKVELPFSYTNVASDVDGLDAIPTMGMNLKAAFGYDTRKVYVHGLTPWDLFEDGILFDAFYQMGLMKSVDGEDAIDFVPAYFGVEGAYAYYKDAMMVKPYLKYRMQMNEDTGAKDADLNIGVDFVKDFTEQFNLEAGLNYMMVMPEDSDVDGESDFAIGAGVNYYVMPELDIFAGFGYWMDMTKDNETDPIMTFTVGAEYTLNLIKK